MDGCKRCEAVKDTRLRTYRLWFVIALVAAVVSMGNYLFPSSPGSHRAALGLFMSGIAVGCMMIQFAWLRGLGLRIFDDFPDAKSREAEPLG
jgi:hypothetical protein